MRRPRSVAHAVVLAGFAVVGVIVLYFAVTFVQVWHASRQDDARKSDAIIVLGAAQFNGTPSAVLRARLDHAADLYKAGMAPLVVVTGGKQEGDRFTEAQASADYLATKGVPSSAIVRENTSTNSHDEIVAAARILHDRGLDRALLVSDGFHEFRIDAIAHGAGLDAHTSPTRTSPVQGADELKALLRETVAVGVGRVLGYDRLEHWLNR